jgi:MAF protein
MGLPLLFCLLSAGCKKAGFFCYNVQMRRFILASQSPRRRELLNLVGYPYECKVADVDETSVTHPDPAVNVVCTAQLKARAIAAHIMPQDGLQTIIIAADTTVALGERMFGKPIDKAAARTMLRTLRNRTHEVHTGVILIDLDNGQEVMGVHTAVVTMRDYTDAEITNYVAGGDPLDKAGAYAIQHPGFRPVANLQGCYLGVMGLSVCHLLQLLRQLNVPQRASATAVAEAHHIFPCPILPASIS